MDPRYTYYAFISYNHRDEKIAKWLQARLEHYKLPAVARKEIGEDVKIRPVFRYVSDLGVAVLREKIKQELAASKYLIVICSPHSAKPNVKGEHWVNDEVKRFIEMGRKDRIIPVIVDGMPGDEKRECFCPALAAAEIAGVDFKAERKTICLQKIVAKLLGLRPDILIQRYLEEQKKRRRRMFVGILPIAALMALSGLFAWDATRIVKRYYVNYVDSFGLPQGIFQLNEGDLKHRHIHYRFEYSGYGIGRTVHAEEGTPAIMKKLGLYRILRRVVQAHSSGSPIKWGHTEYARRPPIQEFQYEQLWPNLGKRVKTICYRDESGVLLKRLELSNAEDNTINGQLEFFGAEAGRGARIASATGSNPLAVDSDQDDMVARTEIAIHSFQRDGKGRITRTLFKSVYGTLVTDEEGVCGYDFELDDEGRCIEQWNLRMNENGIVGRGCNRKGIGGRRYKYSGHNMERAEYVDGERRPVIGPHGWKICIDEFDANDNNIVSTYRNELNECAFSLIGVAACRTAFDDSGNATNIVFLGRNGERTCTKEGICEMRAKYDATGKRTEELWFGIDGKAVISGNSGVAGYRMEYDGHGREKRIVFLGMDGMPVCHKDGNAETHWEYDKRGNRIKETWCGIDGNPILLNGVGIAGWKVEYDHAGRVTRRVWLGADGKPKCHKDGNAEIRWKYGERGNRIEEVWCGIDGKPVLLNERGVAGAKMEYDNLGHMTRKIWLGTDGKPIRHKDGSVESRWRYDRMGNQIEATWHDANGGLVLLNDSNVAGCRMEYDGLGRMTRKIWLGIDGEPRCHKNGEAELRSKYDEYGKKVEEWWFGTDGKRMLINGVSGWKAKYDNLGHMTCKVWMGTNGEPKCHTDGNAETRWKYDERGNETEITWYNASREPVLLKNSDVSGCRMEYDNLGHMTRKVWLGMDGKPRCYKDGNAETRWKYDECGNPTEERWYDTDGKPMSITKGSGIVCQKSRYDVQGNLLERSFYGMNDTPESDNVGCFMYACEYDSFGRRTAIYSYDTDHKPRKLPGKSFYSVRFEYDEYGRVVRQVWLDEELRNTINSNLGYAEVKCRYDDRWRKVWECYYDADGDVSCDKDGVAWWAKSYQGSSVHPCEWDEYGKSGVPCLYGDTGVWHRVTQYDLLGRMTNQSFFSVSDEPIANKRGISRFTVLYTNSVQYVKRCDYYGKDILGHAGVCHKVQMYNMTDEKTYEADYLADDKISWRWRREKGENGQNVTFAFIHKADLIRRGLYEDIKFQQNIAGVNLSVDGLDRISCIEFCDDGGNVVADEDGVVKKQWFYHGTGKELERVDEYGSTHAPCLYGVTGTWHKVELFNTSGMLTNCCLFALDGSPATDKDNVHECRRQYFKGSKIYGREDKYGLASLPRLCGTTGIWHTVVLYDKSGNETNHCHFALDGSRACNTDNQYELAFAYFDNPFRSKRRDIWGRDIWGNTNVAHVVTWYNKRGDLVEQFHFDNKGQPVMGNSGVSHFTKIYYDDTNVLLRLDEYSLKTSPCLYGSTGVWHSVWLYDSVGNETNYCTYASDGSAVCDSNNVYMRTFAYSDDAFRHKRRDLYGSNVWNAVGVTHVVTWYDKKGRVVEQSHFDEAERPIGTLLGGGITRTVTKYCDGSDVVSRFDSYSLPLGYFQTNVWHTVRHFDALGRLTNECYFSKAEQPVADVNGIIRSVRSYCTNQVGHVERLDLYGGAIWGQRGLSHVVRYFDKHNRIVEELRFDTHEKPVPDGDGSVRIVNEYTGDKEMPTRREEFGLSGGKGGLYGFAELTRVVTTFDREDGDLIAMTGYNANGRKRIFRHIAFRVGEVAESGAATSLGITLGDVLCKIDDVDLLSVSSQKELSEIFNEKESKTKCLVVARKNDTGGFSIFAVDLPKGKMGIIYSQRPISDKDYFELIRGADKYSTKAK